MGWGGERGTWSSVFCGDCRSGVLTHNAALLCCKLLDIFICNASLVRKL